MKKKNIRKQFTRNHSAKLRAEILGLLERSNVYLLPERKVPVAVAIEVANRDLRKTRHSDPDARVFSALRAVSAHITLASRNKVTTASAQNSDLLTVGHPASTRPHAMTAAALRDARARWIAADERVADEVRPLVAAAHAAMPGSIERRHAFARLAALDAGLVPLTASVDPIVAVGGFGLGGNSEAARRARAQLQRRDRKGRFAYMGGGFSFPMKTLSGLFRTVSGRVVGTSGGAQGDGIQVEVKGDRDLPDGIYVVPSSSGDAIRAVLSDKAVANLPRTGVFGARRRAALNQDDLARKKAGEPEGWFRARPITDGPGMWRSDDGYYVIEEPNGELSLHRANPADNSVGEKVATARGWADVQRAALGDQDAYRASLKEAEGLEVDERVDVSRPAPAPTRQSRREAARATADSYRDTQRDLRTPTDEEAAAQESNPDDWSSVPSVTRGDGVVLQRTHRSSNPDESAYSIEEVLTSDPPVFGVSVRGADREHTLGRNLESFDEALEVVAADRARAAKDPKTLLPKNKGPEGWTKYGEAAFVQDSNVFQPYSTYAEYVSPDGKHSVVEFVDPETGEHRFSAYRGSNNGSEAKEVLGGPYDSWEQALEPIIEDVIAQGEDKATVDVDFNEPLSDQFKKIKNDGDLARFSVDGENVLFEPTDVSPQRITGTIIDSNGDRRSVNLGYNDIDRAFEGYEQRPRPVFNAEGDPADPINLPSTLGRELFGAVGRPDTRIKYPSVEEVVDRIVDADLSEEQLSELADAFGEAQLYQDPDDLSIVNGILDKDVRPRMAEKAAAAEAEARASEVEARTFENDRDFAVDEVAAKLRSADFYYDYSDDYGAWSSGRASVERFRDTLKAANLTDDEKRQVLEKLGIDPNVPSDAASRLGLDIESAPPAETPAAPEAPRSMKTNRVEEGMTPEQIQEIAEKAIANGELITFNYGGKERVVRPESVTVNEKNGNVNIKGFSALDQGDRTFTISKIEPLEPEPEDVAPEVAGSVDIDPRGDIISQVADAVANGSKVRFSYNGKDREVQPLRIWTNPKNGNRNLEAIDQNGDKKNFTLSKIDPLGTEAPAPGLPLEEFDLSSYVVPGELEDRGRSLYDIGDNRALYSYLVDGLGVESDSKIARDLTTDRRDGDVDEATAVQNAFDYLRDLDNSPPKIGAPAEGVADNVRETNATFREMISNDPGFASYVRRPENSGKPARELIDGYNAGAPVEYWTTRPADPDTEMFQPRGNRLYAVVKDDDGKYYVERYEGTEDGWQGVGEYHRDSFESADEAKRWAENHFRTSKIDEIESNPDLANIVDLTLTERGKRAYDSRGDVGLADFLVDEGIYEDGHPTIEALRREGMKRVGDPTYDVDPSDRVFDQLREMDNERLASRTSVPYIPTTAEQFEQAETEFFSRGSGGLADYLVWEGFYPERDQLIQDLREEGLKPLNEQIDDDDSVARRVLADFERAMEAINDPANWELNPEGDLPGEDKWIYTGPVGDYGTYGYRPKSPPDSVAGRFGDWRPDADGTLRLTGEGVYYTVDQDEDGNFFHIQHSTDKVTGEPVERISSNRYASERDAKLSAEDELRRMGPGAPGEPPAGGPGGPGPRKMDEAEIKEYDYLFETPDGGYKLNIFDNYLPKGRTDEVSPDYTDDPLGLSKYTREELTLALADAVLPRRGDEATGYGMVEFEEGDEAVPAEALYDALRMLGEDPERILAVIYDSGLGGTENTRRYDSRAADMRLLDQADDQLLPSTKVPKGDSTDESDQWRRGKGLSDRMRRVFEQIDGYQETNPTMVSLADELNRAFDDDVFEFGESLDLVLDGYLPLAYSDDAEEREAFAGLWGMLLSLDGGSSDRYDYSDPNGFRGRLFNALVKYHSARGTEGSPGETYEEFLDEYGDFSDFVRNRGLIAGGERGLDDTGAAGAFMRLIKQMSRTNTQPLYRVVPVSPDDTELFNLYTTEGSIISFDPRPFSTTDSTGGRAVDAMTFAPDDPRHHRVVFVAPPGTINSVDVTPVSWFTGENENLSFGQLEVASVRRQPSGLGYADEIIVELRKPERREEPADVDVDAGPELPPIQLETIDTTGWTKTGGQAGSNPGGFYQAPDGSGYYVKTPKSRSHLDNEVLASVLYEALGVPAAKVRPGTDDGKDRIVSILIPDADTADFEERVMRGDEAYLDKIRKYFAIDAWLANYDVTGTGYDNIVTDANGDPVRVDPGGALMWRAQGRPKDSFGDEVLEIDSMRDEDVNWYSGSVFGSMTDDDVRESVKLLLNISPSQIDELVDNIVTNPDDAALLKERLKNRRRYLLERFGVEDTTELDEPELIETGYAAQDLKPGDVTLGDSFVIESVFRDEATPKGKVSVQGYFPGHESQRKEWNENTVIDARRGGVTPPKGDAPALHRPKAPRRPDEPAFQGRIADVVAGAKDWAEIKRAIAAREIVVFDYETTGFDPGNTNKPVQLGAVRMLNGEVVDRFNIFMDPREALGEWSRANLKDADGDSLSDEYLAQQTGMGEAHAAFLEWAGPDAILAAHNMPFDRGVFERALADASIDYEPGGYIDTLVLARTLLERRSASNPDGPAGHRLPQLLEHYGIDLENWHTADADAEGTGGLLASLLDDAPSKPDADTRLDSLKGQRDRYDEKKAEYDAALERHRDEVARYEMDKAIAAAWNCGGGGVNASGLVAAVGDDDCLVPSLDDLIDAATVKPGELSDPEAVTSGEVDSEDAPSTSSIPDETPEADGVDRTEFTPGEGVSAEQKTFDVQKRFEEASEFAESIIDPETTNFKKPSVRKAIEKVIDDFNEVRRAYESGEIDDVEAVERLTAILDDMPKISGTGEDAVDADVLSDYINEVRVTLNEQRYNRPIGDALPPPELTERGWSRDGEFIVPGMRVRDKWGFIGTVLRYSKNGWHNVFVRRDDHEPNEYLSKGTRTLTVVKDDDDQRLWIYNPNIPMGKRPANWEELVTPEERAEIDAADAAEKKAKKAAAKAAAKKKGDDDGEGPVGVKEPEAPDSGGGGEAGEPEAGTTEALRENVEEKAKESKSKKKDPLEKVAKEILDQAGDFPGPRDEVISELIGAYISSGAIKPRDVERVIELLDELQVPKGDAPSGATPTPEVIDEELRSSALAPLAKVKKAEKILTNGELKMEPDEKRSVRIGDANISVDVWRIGNERRIAFGVPDKERSNVGYGQSWRRDDPEDVVDLDFELDDDVDLLPINPYVIAGLDYDSEEGKETAIKFADAVAHLMEDAYRDESFGGPQQVAPYVSALLYAGSRGDGDAMAEFERLASLGRESADERKAQSRREKQEFLEESGNKQITDGRLAEVTTEQLMLTHETSFEPEYDDEGNVLLRPSGDWIQEDEIGRYAYGRGTIHFALNHVVAGHMLRTGHEDKPRWIIVSGLQPTIDRNPDSLDNLLVVDTFMSPAPGQPLVLPKDSVRVLKIEPGTSQDEVDRMYSDALKELGGVNPGDREKAIAYWMNLMGVDRETAISRFGEQIDETANRNALVFEGGEQYSPTQGADALAAKLAMELGVESSLHADHGSYANEQVIDETNKAFAPTASQLSDMSPNAIARLASHGMWKGSELNFSDETDPFSPQPGIDESTLSDVDPDLQTAPVSGADEVEKMLLEMRESYGPSLFDEIPVLEEEYGLPDVLQEYVEDGYQQINSDLRRHDGVPKNSKDEVAVMDRYYDLHPTTTQDVILYRGVHGTKDSEYIDMLEDAEVGDLFVEHAFTSTSTDASATLPFVEGEYSFEAVSRGLIVEIVLPAGSHALDMERLADSNLEEKEILIDRGTTFRVVSKVEYPDGGVARMRVAVVGQRRKTEAPTTDETPAPQPDVEEVAPDGDGGDGGGTWRGYKISQDEDGVYSADNISVSDVYDLRAGVLTPPMLPFFAPVNGGTADPDDGEGYYFAIDGKRYWGRYGAAGALIRSAEINQYTGSHTYLLARRAPGISGGGGKWAYPGGAHKDRLNSKDTTGITAREEFLEEMGAMIEGLDLIGTHVFEPSTGWAYTTQIFKADPSLLSPNIDLEKADGENTQYGWFTADEINLMREQGVLHPDFARSAASIFLAATSDDDEATDSVDAGDDPFLQIAPLSTAGAAQDKFASAYDEAEFGVDRGDPDIDFDDLPLAESYTALENYTDTDYMGINTHLRGGDITDIHYVETPDELANLREKADDLVADLDRLFEAAPTTPVDLVLHRGIHSDYAREIADYPVGAVFHDLGYSSTSLSPSTGEQFSRYGDDDDKFGLVLEIAVPAGTRGVSVNQTLGSLSSLTSEHEILLDRGTTFRVVSKVTDSNGVVKRVRIAVVGQDNKKDSDSTVDVVDDKPVVIEPTGRPRFEPETTKSLSSKPFGGSTDVPSLMDVVDRVINKDGDKMPVLASAIDAGDIEDLEVRAMTIVTPSGERMLRLRFKLTPWAGSDLAIAASDDAEWEVRDRYLAPTTSVDDEGNIVISERFFASFSTGGGAATAVYSYLDDDTDADITLVRSTTDPSLTSIASQSEARLPGPNAYHNMVTIDVPIDKVDGADAPEVIARLLEKAGVRSPRPAEEQDMRVFIENRLISLLVGINDPANNVIEQDRRDDLLGQIKSRYGIGPEDLKVVVDSSGLVRYIMPEDFVFDMMERTDTGFFIHTMTADRWTAASDYTALYGEEITLSEAQDWMIKNLVAALVGPEHGGFGALLSTTSRTLEGIPVSGMSSKTDISSGGADYVYLSPRKGFKTIADPMYGSMTIIFDAANIYERSDLYANSTDQFGSRTPKGDYQMGVYSETLPFMYETMIKGRVGIDAAVGVVVSSEIRDDLLEELRRRGVTEINGVPIEEFIKLSEDSQNASRKVRLNALDTRYYEKRLKDPSGPSDDIFENSIEEIGLIKLPELYELSNYASHDAVLYNTFLDFATGSRLRYRTAPIGSRVYARVEGNGNLLIVHPDGRLYEYRPSVDYDDAVPGIPPSPRQIGIDEAIEIYKQLAERGMSGNLYGYTPLGVVMGPGAYSGGFEGAIKQARLYLENDAITSGSTSLIDLINRVEDKFEADVMALVFRLIMDLEKEGRTDLIDKIRKRIAQEFVPPSVV